VSGAGVALVALCACLCMLSLHQKHTRLGI
jgi:hypothetical protein